ncbi:hypothetical protein [Agilicoccus flavus]|uniref:hypothetical protein n=1 Tax=Agilicoccus flavus TaxID=2775968 RepID=UPI001CF67265|nr:hypothetical protein [Agilicoccus flavus]
MTYAHLPTGWAQRPVTDADLFEDVVDLVVREDSRIRGCVYLLLCHSSGRVAQPVAVEDCPVREDPDRVVDAMRALFARAGDRWGDPRVVLVVGRPGPAAPDAADLRLQRELLRVARDAGLGVIGFALATPAGVTALAAANAMAERAEPTAERRVRGAGRGRAAARRRG